MVFGGTNHEANTYFQGAKTLVECEKLDCEERKEWQRLPSLKEGKSRVNTCIFKDIIYITGAGSYLMEGFSPISESFTPFTYSFPQNNITSLLFSTGEVLFLYFFGTIMQFRASADGLIEISRRPFRMHGKWAGNQVVPDVANGQIYVCGKYECFALSYEVEEKQ